MAEVIVMPKLGLTMKEGTIGKWFKNEGDHVKEGEVLLEVTTDKLTNEIEASCSGILRKIIVPAGDATGCLEPIAIIGDADEDIAGLFTAPTSETAPVQGGVQDQKETAEKVVKTVKQTGRIVAAPAAKKRAKELDIDLENVIGTGPNGRITLNDVDAYSAEKETVKASPMARKTADALNVDMTAMHQDGRIMKADVIDYYTAEHIMALAKPEETRQPMNAMRKTIASRMHYSWQTSPAVTYDMKVDMTALTTLKNHLKQVQKVTFTDLLVKIAAKTLLEFPLVNASIDNDEIILRNYANIGVAVALEEGLIVPVVKYANVKGLSAISKEIKQLASDAKQNQLSGDALSGGTFTITNLGMFGMNAFSPIINQPEVAILGVNAIEDTLVKCEGEIVTKPMMTLSLSADHRVVDGAVAANFLRRMKTYIECPEVLLL